ncbi:MAG TPA: hypothetical protein VGM67_13410 [Gemmatimonadaceae bacterium]
MSTRQLAQIGLGLLGIWALLYAVVEFMQIIALAGANHAPLVLAIVAPIALLLGLSYLLIFHSAKAATAIFPDADDADEPVPPEVVLVLVALVGVLLLVQAAPTAINVLLTLFTVGQSDPTVRGEVIRRLIGSLVPIGVGAYLIVRPGRLIDYVLRPLPEVATETE